MAFHNVPKPDPIICKDQLAALQAQLKNPEWFCRTMFWILVKQASQLGQAEQSRLVPFQWNRIQHDLFYKLARNNRVLKARQAGFTTFFLLVRLLMNVITEPGKSGLLISQNSEYAEKHFLIARRAYKLIGAEDPMDDTKNDVCLSLRQNLLHTRYSNRRELEFDQLDSRLMVATAEVEESGQGVTVHHVVASEVARWPGKPEATVSNVKGALVPGGTFDEESTANGMGGYFCEQYMRSMSNEVAADARAHFYAGYWSEDYRLSLTPKQHHEMVNDIQLDELRLIKRIHREMRSVA